ncbi:hypothetical protein [Sphingomonas japonica]|uniref:Uncharacterized protein n=1 Tax=Sphingomonas japonica TaxID=511662 RepID=A0ABX0TXX5_9SPHN|nr:hypothetical protein [Sphingomonas japonica]NIJ23161.1 hypothetical protein [Sphingomonas japonica]
MKKIVLSALFAATTFVAAPAFAQVSGTVDVTGTVAARCSAITPISGSITLGELAAASGKVDPAFAGNTGGLSRNFTILCNGANPKLSVNARPLVNAAATDSPSGYTNTVHYTATLTAMGAKGGSTSVADQSLSSGATTAQVGDRLATVANNISLTVGSGATAEPTAVLDAGTYAGNVEIIIAPTA